VLKEDVNLPTNQPWGCFTGKMSWLSADHLHL